MLFVATWMDLEIVKLSEVSKTEEENIIWHPFRAEYKKKWYKWSYLQNRNRLRLGEQTYGCQWGRDT